MIVPAPRLPFPWDEEWTEVGVGTGIGMILGGAGPFLKFLKQAGGGHLPHIQQRGLTAKSVQR